MTISRTRTRADDVERVCFRTTSAERRLAGLEVADLAPELLGQFSDDQLQMLRDSLTSRTRPLHRLGAILTAVAALRHVDAV